MRTNKMSQLISTNSNNPMMGSREIAVVVLKEHKEVCRDIRVMLVQLYGGEEKDYIRSANLLNLTNQGVSCVHYDMNNPNAWEYFLDFEHSQCLATGYDALRRMSMVKQWRTMKEELEQPRIAVQSAPQENSMNNDILSLARVVAEATASATMKAVIDIVGIQKYQPVVEPIVAIAPPAPEALQINHQTPVGEQSEYALVSDLSWACGLSDDACRRLTTFSKLPTRLTNGDRGHLLIHRDSFMSAAQTLLDESTPPTGKLKRWQHPAFGGFTLRLKSESHNGETK
ncbi:Rha family transcriptional regulator [Yersinia intermedia]|uniref:Rha family transcriptional regulator n=2 Tax=Yersinia intermedia TaxID=631 RepID=UPI001CFE2762|nr:Rha family transcriptional regulator [Yersinia intermedia]MCB5322105.1 Rha family transcriptional regulator [Yersinia intermedia]MCB5325140.1 Rha family transcriptional regulator [Yersinia intermedia]